MTPEQMLAQMTPEQFAEWKARQPVTPEDVRQAYQEARSLPQLPNFIGEPKEVPRPPTTGRIPHTASFAYVEPTPSPTAPSQARPADEVWGAPRTFDFVCPSGATCLMRRLDVEALLEQGILDQVTRLPGIAQGLIDKAENAMPVKAPAIDEADTIRTLVTMVNVIVPMAVVTPEVLPPPSNDEERVVGRIYADSISLQDRIAIMNRALAGLVALDPFRQGSGEPR